MNATGNALSADFSAGFGQTHREAATRKMHRAERELEEFVNRYGDLVLAEAWRRLRNEEEALTLAEDVLRRAFRRSSNRPLEGDLKMWLQRITAAAVLGRMRAASSEPDIEVRHFQDSIASGTRPSPSLLAWSQEPGTPEFPVLAERYLRAALETLPLQLRAVLLLKDFDKLPIDNIAQLLGIESQCVRHRLNEARLALTYRAAQAVAAASESGRASAESIATR